MAAPGGIMANDRHELGESALQKGRRPRSPLVPRGEPGPPRLSGSLEEAVGEAAPAPHGSRHLDRFLREPSVADALVLWLGPDFPYCFGSVRALRQTVAADIVRIDDLLSRQINEILHHPEFQRLEASWRGLEFLVRQTETDDDGQVRVKVLDVAWKEIALDVRRAIEFDMSQLFRKVYEEEFGMAGGEPFTLLVGDYEFKPHPDDLEVLESIAGVAAASFAPFITGADPSFFGVGKFSELERPIHLGRIFEQETYIKWRAFRKKEDARFVGLTLPRVLMRVPYEDDGRRSERFRFREEVEGADSRRYLWGNSAYAFAEVVIRAFARYRWMADIRGFSRGELGGGLVAGLPCPSFGTDREGTAWIGSTDLFIDEHLEKELGDLGFVPLCQLEDAPYCVFYGNQSVQSPAAYQSLEATMNARISTMLQYILCVSRFAHYLKAIGRQKLGSFQDPKELQDVLHRWVYDYVSPDQRASPAVKARFPLRDAQVLVKEDAPGRYSCTMHLQPHYQLDAVAASVVLRTELKEPSR